MKKSRIFLAGATLVLAVSAVFATKANKKFAPISTGFLASSDGYVKNVAIGNLLTNVATGHKVAYVEICTVNGTAFGTTAELFTTATGSNPVYIH